MGSLDSGIVEKDRGQGNHDLGMALVSHKNRLGRNSLGVSNQCKWKLDQLLKMNLW